MHDKLIASLAALAVAACQPAATPPDGNAADQPPAANVARPSAITPEPPAEAATAIPAAIHGRWGLVPADCTSTRGDAHGLLTITADTLRFYESVARLDSATEIAPDRLTGSFAFEGEGQRWTRVMTLSLEGAGARLVRSEEGDGEPLRLDYRRCPA